MQDRMNLNQCNGSREDWNMNGSMLNNLGGNPMGPMGTSPAAGNCPMSNMRERMTQPAGSGCCNMGGMPVMSCDMLLRRVYEAGFAMDDAVLYLDTHPCDKEALKYYHYVANLYQEAVSAYESQCGALMYDSVRSEDYWTWVNGPWPWEGVCG